MASSLHQRRFQIGDVARSKHMDFVGKIVEENGHACKLCGIWFHGDELIMQAQSHGDRTFAVSALSGEFQAGPLDASGTVLELKSLICEERDFKAIQLLLEGEKLSNSTSLADIPEDAELICVVVAATLVLDCGSTVCRAGFAGDDAPTVQFPCVVGRPKVPGLPCNAAEVLVGEEAKLKRDILKLKYPIEGGLVTNWEDMEKVWHHAFYNELRINPSEHRLLLTEPPVNPAYNRESTLQRVFETFQVRSAYLAQKTTLTLYAEGKVTGLVMDIGDRMRYTVPIYEGYAMPHAILQYSRDAGADLTESLWKKLSNNGALQAPTTAGLEIVRAIKESCCYIALDFDSELSKDSHGRTYELPDGTVIALGIEAFRCPEALFNPYLEYGGKFYRAGLHDDIFNAVRKCDVDVQSELYGSIVLTGGSSLFPGMGERLLRELYALAPSGVPINVKASSNPVNSSWIGGSILASQDAFETMWITADDYEEKGPALVNKRCVN